ncbi:hypothetical protein C0J52_15110 [Blattella germanica]|nr:hypothetical protein C0J52_15110 [Blattella germanica]
MLISSYLNEVDLNLLPSTNDSVFFIKTIPNKTQQELEPIISSMEKKIQHLQKWANQSLETIDSIVDRFVSRKKLLQFKDTMENFMEKANNLNIPSQNSWFSGRALLLLLPGFHGLTVLFIMIIASVVGIHEIRRLNDGCKLEPQFKNSYGAKVIRDHMKTSEAYYMFCLPVMDFTVFYRYLDNIKVWDNKTWVDSVIQEFATNYSERIWFMQLLENCENNNTLYEALHMENVIMSVLYVYMTFM